MHILSDQGVSEEECRAQMKRLFQELSALPDTYMGREQAGDICFSYFELLQIYYENGGCTECFREDVEIFIETLIRYCYRNMNDAHGVEMCEKVIAALNQYTVKK